jgi:hypothetical protein
MEDDMRKIVLMTALAFFGASAAASAADPSRSPACDPRNAPPTERADLLHQNRPGGSDCSPQSARRTQEEAIVKERQMRGQRDDDRRLDRVDPRDEGYSGSSLPPRRTYRP